MFRHIVHCSPKDCFSFHKIRQNIPVYVSPKRVIQKFWSILNLQHLLTSSLIQQEKLWCSWRFQKNVSTPKTWFKFQDLRNKKCVENKHLSNAKATFPSSIWFNKYFLEYDFAFTMIPFPTFWTFCHEVFLFFLYVFLEENIFACAKYLIYFVNSFWRFALHGHVLMALS